MPAHAPEELHALLEDAFNTRDLDAFVDLYDEDAALVVPPGGERVSGRAAIRASVEGTFALEPDLRSEVVEKLEGATMALTHARWSLAGTGADGSPVLLAGRGTMVSRRRSDGSWRIVLDNPMTP
jgi:uncharacterized protein (TIGR02246 family)